MNSAATLAAGLPPRTWRHWWLAWPKWFRIGCWAFVGLALLHVALAVRFYFGLQESADIRELQKVAHVTYFWEHRTQPFRGYHWLMAGLYGRSNSNVSSIYSRHACPEWSDANLAIVSRFPQVWCLSLQETAITAEGLRSLRPCQKLRTIDLTNTDIGDSGLECLRDFPELKYVTLRGTRITDAAIPLLDSLPQLSSVDLSWTRVTASAFYSWRSDLRRTRGKKFYNMSIEAELPHVFPEIHWADGEVSEQFPLGELELTCFRFENDNEAQESEPLMYSGRSGFYLSINDALGARDFDDNRSRFPTVLKGRPHRIVLMVENYVSEPVDIDVNDIPTRIEFHMSVTRGEALQAVARRIHWQMGGK